MKTSAIIREIDEYIRSHSFDTFEEENLQHDLHSILARLKTHQYTETDFIDRNTFDAGKRTEEFFHYLEGYVHQSKIWLDILRPILNRYAVKSITDICPGWAPKIELALCQLMFDGTVTLFDQEERSITKLDNILEQIRPSFLRKTVIDNFLSDSNKPQSDLTVCNHIVDDLLFSIYSKESGVPLSAIYHDEASYIHAVHSIIAREDVLSTFPNTFIYHTDKFIPNHGIFIMRHYPSLTETALELQSWIGYCKKIIDGISDGLLQKGYRHLGSKSPEFLIIQKTSNTTHS